MSATVDPLDIAGTAAAAESAKAAADVERQKVADAKEVLAAAAKTLAKASDAFKSKPTSENALAKMVAGQEHANAQEAAERAISDARSVLELESRAMMVHDYAKHMARLATFWGEVDAIIDRQIVAGEAMVRTGVEALEDRIAKHNVAVQSVSITATKLGLPFDWRTVKLDELRLRVRHQLEQGNSRGDGTRRPNVGLWVTYQPQ